MTAKQFTFYDDWKNEVLTCPNCGWSGTFEHGAVDYSRELMDSSCPECKYLNAPMLAIVSFPTLEETEANFDRLSENEKAELARRKQFISEFESRCLKSPDQLPDLLGAKIILSWDFVENEKPEGCKTTIIRHDEHVVWSEPALWEGYGRFRDVARILMKKYGKRLGDVIPTAASQMYLYGDSSSASGQVERARAEIESERNE